MAVYIELNEAKTRGSSDEIGTFGDLRPIYLVFCAREPDNAVQHPRNSDVKTPRSNRSRHQFIPSSPVVDFAALGKFMTAKSRFMAALIVLLAHFATAATARSRRDQT